MCFRRWAGLSTSQPSFGKYYRRGLNGSESGQIETILPLNSPQESSSAQMGRIPGSGKHSKYRFASESIPTIFFFMLAGSVASFRAEAREDVARGEMAGFFPTA